MNSITAFIMTHPDVTVEIKKDANFYQSISIKMKKNNAVTKRIIGEDRLTGLDFILAYMYAILCGLEEDEVVEFQAADADENKWGRIKKECPMRSEIGNCLAMGGFCTSVSKEICEALQNAYIYGKHSGNVYPIEISNEVLQKAVYDTAIYLVENIEVEKDD